MCYESVTTKVFAMCFFAGEGLKFRRGRLRRSCSWHVHPHYIKAELAQVGSGRNITAVEPGKAGLCVQVRGMSVDTCMSADIQVGLPDPVRPLINHKSFTIGSCARGLTRGCSDIF